MAAVDDAKLFFWRNKLSYLVDRPHGRGQTNSLERRAARFDDKIIEAGERQRKMRAALVVHHRMNFVDDHRLGGLQHFATAFGRKQNEERFGSSDQNVRWPLDHLLPFKHGSIARPHSNSD